MRRQYLLVVNKDATDDEFNELCAKFKITVDEHYEFLKRHYLVTFSALDKAAIKDDKIVIHATEHDAPVQMTGVQSIDVSNEASNDNWGLARITAGANWNDSRWFPLRGEYRYSRTGEGVDAYVIDTGIRRTHSDFEGRVEVIFDYYRQQSDPLYGEDRQGHGTHVASTIAGKKFGVAKKAKLLVARIFDTGGAPLVAVIGGINAVLAHHEHKKANGINRPSVCNLSIGGPKVTIEEQALNDCIEAGIILVAAAGNDGKNLDLSSYNILPAEIERAVTVGAVDVKDRIATFSNYGSSVDLFAPGVYICAAGISNDSAQTILSGTSMAAPHVAGVLCLAVQGENIGTNSKFVRTYHDMVKEQAISNTILLHEAAVTTTTPNKMLYNYFSTSAVEEPTTPTPVTVTPPTTTPTPVTVTPPKSTTPPNGMRRRRNPKLDNMMNRYRNNAASIASTLSIDIVTIRDNLELGYNLINSAITDEEVLHGLDVFFKAKSSLDNILQDNI